VGTRSGHPHDSFAKKIDDVSSSNTRSIFKGLAGFRQFDGSRGRVTSADVSQTKAGITRSYSNRYSALKLRQLKVSPPERPICAICLERPFVIKPLDAID
jgi:hypothetical protein